MPAVPPSCDPTAIERIPVAGPTLTASALASLPAHVRRRLEGALASGLVTASSPPSALRAALGSGYDQRPDDIFAGLRQLEALGITGRAAAAWLRTTAQATRPARPADLVWSGPEVAGLHARDTRCVYEELMGSAERSLWASTFAFFDGPQAFAVLARRMEQQPALAATLLLNIQRRRGDTTRSDHLVRRFADRFWGAEWPGAARPTVYYDARSLDPDGPAGVLHAKAVVADDESVFVTSANLTEAALDRNIELGLLVRDRPLALKVAGHFRGLIERGLLARLPE